MFKMFFKKKKNFSNFFFNFIGFLQFFGLILMCSGSKSCPETTRAHLTRCDKYFRCTQLSNKTYVWIPAQCDKGLVYEPSLKMCVLPGDNWECYLTEEVPIQQISMNDENNVYGVNNIQMGDYSSEEMTLNDDNSASFGDESSEDNDSSELYMETTTSPSSLSNSSSIEVGDEYESSGDGYFTQETKEYVINNNHINIPESIDFDNRLTSHLQRLTQLIDSIKNQNNTNDPKKELMADQLNHFLDNYNLMTQQIYDGNDTNKITVPEDGHMHPDHIEEIIAQQNKLTIDDVVKQKIKTGINDGTTFYSIKEPDVNIEFKSIPHTIKKGYRQPEVKIPHSQIIINRPGGSVLFNIDSNNYPEIAPSGTPQRDDHPLISEETLKTVLELSKQMVQNQNNNRQVYPIYYTVPIPVISNEKQTTNKKYDEKPPISVTNSFNTYGEDLTRNHQGYVNSGNHDGGNNISTTVIFDDHGLSSGWNAHHNKYNPVQHQDQEPYLSSNYDTQFNKKPNSNFQTFPTYYHPTYTEFDSYQPSYYPQYEPDNPYKSPSSYYQDPQDLYPPYISPFYTNTPDSANIITTPAPTTTTPSTTTEHNSREDNDDDMYSDEIATGSDNIGFPQINYYNPLASNLGLLNGDSQDKLINFGGSFISYNSYKNTLLPLLQPSTLGGGLEILTCSTGVRQPNMTDCSRYYVCNPRTQNVLSYACPPFTAFNKGTKICDAKSYAICKPEAIMNRYTVAENMRLQQEAQKAIANAQKIQNDAFKTSALAAVMQSHKIVRPVTTDDNRPIKVQHSNTAAIVPSNQNQPTKKRRIRCYDTGKISDPDSSRDYWVCFRGSNGRMRRQKMTCASGLIFCKKTRYCTLSKKC